VELTPLYDVASKGSNPRIGANRQRLHLLPRPKPETVRAQVGGGLAAGDPLPGEFAKLPTEVGLHCVIVLLGLVGSVLEVDGNKVVARCANDKRIRVRARPRREAQAVMPKRKRTLREPRCVHVSVGVRRRALSGISRAEVQLHKSLPC
jgi:hypothetical protein